MLTYDYICRTCLHEWEAEQAIADPRLTTCPACGRETAKRLVSGGTGFILRGEDWAGKQAKIAERAKR